jgi:hypothetical protein
MTFKQRRFSRCINKFSHRCSEWAFVDYHLVNSEIPPISKLSKRNQQVLRNCWKLWPSVNTSFRIILSICELISGKIERNISPDRVEKIPPRWGAPQGSRGAGAIDGAPKIRFLIWHQRGESPEVFMAALSTHQALTGLNSFSD